MVPFGNTSACRSTLLTTRTSGAGTPGASAAPGPHRPCRVLRPAAVRTALFGPVVAEDVSATRPERRRDRRIEPSGVREPSVLRKKVLALQHGEVHQRLDARAAEGDVVAGEVDDPEPQRKRADPAAFHFSCDRL